MGCAALDMVTRGLSPGWGWQWCGPSGAESPEWPELNVPDHETESSYPAVMCERWWNAVRK